MKAAMLVATTIATAAATAAALGAIRGEQGPSDRRTSPRPGEPFDLATGQPACRIPANRAVWLATSVPDAVATRMPFRDRADRERQFSVHAVGYGKLLTELEHVLAEAHRSAADCFRAAGVERAVAVLAWKVDAAGAGLTATFDGWSPFKPLNSAQGQVLDTCTRSLRGPAFRSEPGRNFTGVPSYAGIFPLVVAFRPAAARTPGGGSSAP
jgi:hypothetical protein